MVHQFSSSPVVYSNEFDSSVATFNVVCSLDVGIALELGYNLSLCIFMCIESDCRQLSGSTFMTMQNHSHFWKRYIRTLNLLMR